MVEAYSTTAPPLPLCHCMRSVVAVPASFTVRAPWNDSSGSIRIWCLVHGPVHASWLNQIEIYFSIVQRKVLTPNDFDSLADVETRLLAFQRHYQSLARPFEWTFTRRDLARLLAKLALQKPDSIAA